MTGSACGVRRSIVDLLITFFFDKGLPSFYPRRKSRCALKNGVHQEAIGSPY